MEALLALIVALSTPCEYEDSTNCVWVASESGNDVGSSFIDIEGAAYYSEDVDSYER